MYKLKKTILYSLYESYNMTHITYVTYIQIWNSLIISIFLEEIKRLRAEGDRLLEEEQSKFRIAKKSQDEYARIKLSWDASAKTYSAKELKNVLGASAVVLSSKKEGRAIAEFDTWV